MTLSWKDAAATVLTGFTETVAYARLRHYKWPLLHNWRTASLVVLLLGFAICIVAGWGIVLHKNTWTTTATVLGSIAGLAGILGIIFNNKVCFIVLAGAILVLWLLATIDHTMAKAA